MTDTIDSPQVFPFRPDMCRAIEHTDTPEREAALRQAHALIDRLGTADVIATLPVLGKYAHSVEQERRPV